MAKDKLTKHAAVLNELFAQVRKQAEHDETKSSVQEDAPKAVEAPDAESAKDNDIDKNTVKPEALDGKQVPEQKVVEETTKVSSAKGARLLEKIQMEVAADKSKDESVQNDAPSKIEAPDAESAKDNDIDKNTVKPEALNGKQVPEQKVVNEETSVTEIAEKVASYEMGRQFVTAVLGQLSGNQKTAADAELIKQAGRRDAELLINHAIDQFQKQSKVKKQAGDLEVIKSAAEQMGAEAFLELQKQAQVAAIIEENQQLKQLLQEQIAAEEQLAREVEANRLAVEKQAFVSEVTDSVVTAVLAKLSQTPAPAQA